MTLHDKIKVENNKPMTNQYQEKINSLLPSNLFKGDDREEVEWRMQSLAEYVQKDTIQARNREIIEKIGGMEFDTDTCVHAPIEDCSKCGFNEAIEHIITTLIREDNEQYE